MAGGATRKLLRYHLEVSPKAPPADAVPAGEELAKRWRRVVMTLRSAELRVAYLRVELRAVPADRAAEALERLCALTDAGDERSASVLHALIELFADPALGAARDALREEARSRQLFTLGRLLRRPFVSSNASTKSGTKSSAKSASASHAGKAPSVLPPSGDDDSIALASDQEQVPTKGIPDYGRGRPLTLGERKSLARRPTPALLPKILGDPHPDVIRNLLASARLTEDDVVRLVTRRPNRSEVLLEVARHPRWCHRPRVRMALVLNAATPTEIAISMVGLLRRHELPIVVETTALHPAVRAAAHERWTRLPPVRREPDGSLQ